MQTHTSITTILRLLLLALIMLLWSGHALLATGPLFFAGTVTNTTDETHSITAGALITFDTQGSCVVRIGKPLYGSGVCSIAEWNKNSGKLELVSNGPVVKITWDGALREDGQFVGDYVVEYPSLPDLPEIGTFLFGVRTTGEKVLKVSDVLSSDTVTVNGKDYLLWRDGNIISVHHKDGTYAGLRIFLNEDNTPQFIVKDYANGSTYLDAASRQVLLKWVVEGKSGYFQSTREGLTTYYDRFMRPTGWLSITTNSKQTFIRRDSNGAELYDDAFKPLGVRLSKTSDGELYWAVDKGRGVTEFFDGKFNTLHWYSVQANGQTYYAHEKGKKFRLYDSSLHPLSSRRPSFWSRLAVGVAEGLSAYGQAMQTWQAQQNQTSTSTPEGYSPVPIVSPAMRPSPGDGLSFSTASTDTGDVYQTTSQQLGTFNFSNTTGSNGYQAHSTTQSIGNFDYTYGTSTEGNFSGTGQRIGNFNYTHLMTGAETWDGTAQQIGNFTFYNFSGPNGQHYSGTSQRIGNFIFTNIR
jgi:hypothetical protein